MIYIYQPVDLEVTLEEYSGSLSARIRYTKPNGETGYWSAGVTLVGNLVEYHIPNGVLDQAGTWTFRTFVTYTGGDEYPYEAITQYVSSYD